MAAPAKKREIDNETKESDKIESNDESSDENEDNFINEQGQKIMVDFIGRTPEDCDFHGIKILLQQLFLKAHINLTALAEYIISHNYVGSVVKQGDNDEDDGDDDDDDHDVDGVYGVTSIINISHGQNEECIQQLRNLLKELASEYATDSTNAMINNILQNDSEPLGLIINERFINIPADISVPLLENLINDMKRANAKKMPYDFRYFILISKLYKPKTDGNKKNTNKSMKKKGDEEPEIFWSNQEEEILDEDALFKFEFATDKESDTGISGTWAEDDDEMTPYRRVMLFDASKLPTMIDKIKKFIAN